MTSDLPTSGFRRGHTSRISAVNIDSSWQSIAWLPLRFLKCQSGVRLGTMIIEGQMAKKTVRQKRPRKRAEQQRALETRASILDAAIAEFAERGFEGASIRAIADRLGLQHPLITYHYRSKDILWRAAAEHAFSQIRAGWDISAPENSDLP